MLCLCLLLLAVCGSAVKCGGYTTGADMAKNHDMSGKILLITGGDSGIGFETALATARSGGQIVIASLDPESTGAAAKQKITQNVTSAKVEVLKLDLSDFSSVRACAAAFLVQHKTLDVLMNDAGIDHNPPSLPPMTVDGYERVFQVNYLGHFLLTQLLLPALRASASSPRIINVASGAHEDACNWASAKSNCLDIDQLPPPVRALGNNTEGAPISNYGITKFLQIYHAKELALRESQAKSSVQAFSLEPGFVDTPMTRNLSPATHHK